MRVDTPFTLATLLAIPLVSGASTRAHHAVLARRATCQPCVCDNDSGARFVASPPPSSSSGRKSSGGGGSVSSGSITKSRGNAIALELPADRPVKQRPVPRVKPSESSIKNGASKALDDFIKNGNLSKDVAEKVSKAFEESLKNNTHHTSAPVDVVDAPGNVVFSTNDTANALSQTAIINIRKAIQDALNAATLAESNLDADTKAQLSTCLTAILSNGGMPANYSCVTGSGSTSAGLSQTLRTILEQFLGILPNKIIEGVFDAVMPQLTDLLPDEYNLVENINKAIESITASASGGSVTALNQLQDCYDQAVVANGNTSYLQCYTSSGALETLESSMRGVINQFVGVLPPNLINSVNNLVAFQLGNGNDNVTQALQNAIESVGASLSGSTVTIYEQLEKCANKLLIDGDERAAKDCTVAADGPANSARVLVNSISQQLAGYLPSEFFTLLSKAAEPFLTSSDVSEKDKANVAAALQSAFDNSRVGPAYVGCFLEIQDCVVNAIVEKGDASATCGASVINGCQRIGASGNSVVGSITATPSSTSSPAAAAAPAASSTSVEVAQAKLAAAAETTSEAAAEEPKPTSTSEEVVAAKEVATTSSEAEKVEATPSSSAEARRI